MEKMPTRAAQEMLRILKERTRTVKHHNTPDGRVDLILNPRDLFSARVYTPEDVAHLREHFISDAPIVLGEMGVHFVETDVADYLYALRNKDWEYSKNAQRAPTLVLNFASARRPGGNVRYGGHGQEESLCENSTLLATLESDCAAEFYRIQQAADSLRTDAMILSPFVEVFGVNGMQRSNSDIVAVLSAVPPRSNGNAAALEKAMYQRIRGMLYVAAKEGYKHLVLGAWGCGSAGNDPELVASQFERALRENVPAETPDGKPRMFSYRWKDFFNSVTFAVPKGKASESFKARFSDFYRAEREERHQKIRDEIAEDRKKYLSAIKGSLVGGAIGDALGYPVEFMSYNSIIRRHGEGGIQLYEKDFESGLALISDDTQMTLFTATGMLVGETRGAMRGIAAHPESYVHASYRNWYFCQCDTSIPADNGEWLNYGHRLNISWLSYLPEMHQQRAPGNTCMSALRSGDGGTMDDPINHSKGCGGVMRIAPVALYFQGEKSRELLKNMCFTAAKVAALTHGHPLGYMPAAALAHIIHRSAFGGCPYGDGLHGILKDCREMMQDMFRGEQYLSQMLSLMERAEALVANGRPDAENIESLGGGWVAEETLAIAIYCCLRYPDDFSKAVIAAVNHSGDSDSTGAVVGNIMGAWLGYEKIDSVWLKDLELRTVIEEVATDLCDHCRMSEYGDYRDKDWERKYIHFGNCG